MYFIVKKGNGCIMELDKNFIAQVIQDSRRKANLTQAQLAEKIGLSEKHISKIETGKYYPALDTFIKILDALNLTLADFKLQHLCENSSKKEQLQKLIQNSSKKQIDTLIDIIPPLLKHV